MVLSADPQRDPSTLAIIGAGASLAISDIPFHHVLGGVRVGSINGKLVANPSYDETRESQDQHHCRGQRRGHRDGGSRARSRRPRPKCWRPSNLATSAARRSPPAYPELVKKAGKTKRAYTPPEINKELYAQIEKQIRVELTDAMDTKKYPKLESYHRVHEAKKKVLRGASGRAEGRSRRAVRRAERARLPR